jgi:hypothetical protein
MIEFTPRRFKFKAWNLEARLLLKLSSIDCKKGELFMKDHILLQYTGHVDKQEEEIYEMDIVLLSSEKFLVVWDENSNGWFLSDLKKQVKVQRFAKEIAEKATRLCSYFESEHNR